MTPPDIRRLIEVLDRYDVEYLLVGGVAALAHGATRQTADVDCVVRRTKQNLERLAAAMHELNARLHVEGMSDEEAATLPIHLDAAWLARLEISTWRTDAGDLDILADIPDGTGVHRGYDALAARARVLRHEGIRVHVAALDDIIASKEWSDRPKDQQALPELRALRDQKADGP